MRLKLQKLTCLFVCLFISLSSQLHAQALGSAAANEELRGIDEQIQTLKKEVIQINSELSLLEEKLLFPSSTQTAIFVSMPDSVAYIPDSIELRIDDQVVANHLYIFREVDSLKQGGVQRLIMTNMTSGMHKLDVKLISRTQGGEVVEALGEFSVEKGIDPVFVEIQMRELSGAPSLELRNW